MSPKQKILVCEDVWKEKFGEVQVKLYALPSLFVELGDNNEWTVYMCLRERHKDCNSKQKIAHTKLIFNMQARCIPKLSLSSKEELETEVQTSTPL